jgi:hypothetical protein
MLDRAVISEDTVACDGPFSLGAGSMSGLQRFALCSSVLALVLVTGTFSSSDVSAQTPRLSGPEWLERCKRWIERKGYPVDYIEQKVGKRQPGFAPSWKGNVKPDEARAGDVAIISWHTRDGLSGVRAAYIEEVEPPVSGSGAFLKVSGFMQGMGRAWVDQECLVGEHFGRVVHTRVPLSEVVRVWRPDLPLE